MESFTVDLLCTRSHRTLVDGQQTLVLQYRMSVVDVEGHYVLVPQAGGVYWLPSACIFRPREGWRALLECNTAA
jgi:hypothetical protein